MFASLEEPGGKRGQGRRARGPTRPLCNRRHRCARDHEGEDRGEKGKTRKTMKDKVRTRGGEKKKKDWKEKWKIGER